MIALTVQTPMVDLDPNNLDPRGTGWHVALFADANQQLQPQMLVQVRQAGDTDDDTDWVGLATVTEVNNEHAVAYLAVDWDSFRDHELDPVGSVADVTGQLVAPSDAHAG